VLLRRWSRDTDQPATYSGLYPAGEDEVLPRVAVVLTGADEAEFQQHWFGHTDALHEKFDRFLDDRAGVDLTGESFRLIDCAAPVDSPWRAYTRRGERTRGAGRAAEHYGRYPGREHVPTALAGPGVRRTVAVLVLAVVAIVLVSTLARRPAALLGVLPAFAWMAYLRRKDRVRPESPAVLTRAALAGVLATGRSWWWRACYRWPRPRR